jgi:uncharacterized Tic20 family protein
VVAIPGTAPVAGSDAVTSLTSDERTWGMLCHLSGLIALLVLGGLSFVGPLICWLVKKDTSKWVDDNGKEALNFHLNILIYNAIILVAAVLTCVGGILFLGTFILAIVTSILGTIAANNGKRYEYPAVMVRLIK